MLLQSKIIIIVAAAIVITGCSPAEPEKSETENQASSSAVASSESQTAAVSSTMPESTTTEAVQAPKTAMSPKETYIKMMAEFASVQTYADIGTAYLRYATKEQISKYEAERVLMNNAAGSYFDPSHDMRENEDKSLADFKTTVQAYNTEITTIQESVNGSTASLILGTKFGDSVSMSLVLENNQWKLTDESWQDLH